MFVFFVLHFASRSKTKERRILESLEKLFFGKKSLPKIYDKSFLRPQGGFAGGKCTLTFFLLRKYNPYSFITPHLPKMASSEYVLVSGVSVEGETNRHRRTTTAIFPEIKAGKNADQ